MSIKLKYSKEVETARERGLPLLALESTIISHGMPYPENIDFALKAESLCRSLGVTPATIAIIKGEICVGLDKSELEKVARSSNIKKVSKREIGTATTMEWNGATTVSSTMQIARMCRIRVFSTGGIGGAHRNSNKTFDVSQDLIALSNTPMVVVSSGAKSILDLPKTLEVLETFGVCLLGYQTDEFPSFYSRSSGLEKITKATSTEQVTRVFLKNELLKLQSATLVVNPIPKEHEIPFDDVETIINNAIRELEAKKLTGKAVTPFLLDYIHKQTNGKSLNANISLALSNVRLGARISRKLNKKDMATDFNP